MTSATTPAVNGSTATASSSIPGTIRRFGGGGPRRIAESAGVVITHGEGAWLVDQQGRRYLDFATAMGVAAIGHGHPRFAESLACQARKLAACVLHTPEQARYLSALAAVLPGGVDRVALYSGGAEAVEVAVRLAQSYTDRRHLISFTDGFHGKTLGLRFTGNRFAEEHERLGPGWVHHVPYPYCSAHDAACFTTCRGDGADSLAALDELASSLDGVAAVIVEPVMGTAGNRPPQRRFLAGLRELCTRKGWLLIADESITGFGRLGTTFACDYFGVVPDILVLGKAMGGGFPLSGVAAPGWLWDASLFSAPSATSSSYGANPLACVAGLAVLDIVGREGFLENATAVARLLALGLREIEQRSPFVKRTRGVGMMLGFDFVDPSTGTPAGPELCLRLFRACLEQGLLLVGDVPGVRLNPPLILTELEAERALEALDAAVCR
ncbi:MAG TPA: aspartate aminotransferase family protein [Candidatus Sulfotelmatobacter sp.]|nr:aspartate aminotransferase family protein [Candidatus Sulfotelmatobacter sp.]